MVGWVGGRGGGWVGQEDPIATSHTCRLHAIASSRLCRGLTDGGAVLPPPCNCAVPGRS
jgi:hypothetical protein